VKHVDEYRDDVLAGRYAHALARATSRPWTIMEVCGGQTHAIVKFGVDRLLPARLSLVHGPGCPVCVTPVELIDQAIELARRADVVMCSFGDMLRTPGSSEDLLRARAAGGDVRVVYSPLDAVRIAAQAPEREVVFFAVGFETTAPASALAILEARRRGLRNFSMLVAHVRVPPAMEAILRAPDNRVQGFLAAGHVCTVMGCSEYHPIAARYRVPIVVTGFEPLDLLQGLLMCVRQLERGQCRVQNQYARAVREAGNAAARALLEQVFEPVARRWRGMEEIPASGLALRQDYRDMDAQARFAVRPSRPVQASECRAGLVLRGAIKPDACPAFGTRCTPERPLGAPMVSSEGACAAYYHYRRREVPALD
jgi:hydrogenase expression/formation protein HypD